MENTNLQQIENSAAKVDEMVSAILSDELNETDNYLQYVRNCFLKEDEILDDDLDRILLQIPTYLYSLIVYAQQIEMRKGLSSEQAKYAKNEALLNATGTVADKSARAENLTIESRIVELAYKTASSIVQKKIDGALALYDATKRVQQRRHKEKVLTGIASNAVGNSAF